MNKIGAGFRYSSYGIGQDPGPDYFVSVGRRMQARFPGATPECIWIVGNYEGHGIRLSFPLESDDPFVTSSKEDKNEEVLALFDEQGFKVWLQVEPGNANVPALIQAVLGRYKRHPSVTGFGVDVEWYKSDGEAEGKPVSDEEARLWVSLVQAINPDYRLFLKHWETEWLPPAFREGLVFIDDSQQFDNFERLQQEFAEWGRHFAPAPVAFQFGYPADKRWWNRLKDPPAQIGKAILENVPNTTALFWVDFSLKEVFPPSIK